jgi:molecular chaperone DnaK
VVEAKEAHESNDTDRTRAAKEKLTSALHKMSQAMYGAGQEAQQGPGGAPGAEGAGPSAGGAPEGSAPESESGDGEVIDAEFEEKN